MNDQEIRDVAMRALTKVAPEIDPTTVDPGAHLQEDLDLDSMDFLNLVIDLGEQTGVEVPERDYPQLATIDGIVAYLAARVSA